MITEKDIEFKNKVLNETDNKKITNLLISKSDVNFVELFSDEEFINHLRKYFKLAEDEATKHVYIRKFERKD